MQMRRFSSKIETRLFINGKFVNSVSGKTFPCINPATEETICQVQEAGHEDVDLAVKAARNAFAPDSEWRTMPSSGRRDIMLNFASLIEKHKEELSHLETMDNGKPLGGKKYGSSTDIYLVVQCLRYYAGWADKIMGKTIPVDSGNNQLVYTLRQPIGVTASIIPWNFPALMMAWKIAPVLATGCTTIVKTSEKTPLSALFIAGLSKKAGLPDGVLNVLSGYGKTAGAPLALHQDVDKVAFTGSTAVGKEIMKMAAESNLKRVTLELGGKSPMIVFNDADLNVAVNVAHTALFLNHGQCKFFF
jgi:aldehyde dehydrogenase (NAD+)